MPDSPDYSKYLTGNVRFSLQDLGELAARLGSPHSFDRRGELVWFDNFQSGLNNWATGGSGTGNAVNLSVTNVYRWPFIANLLAGTSLSKSAIMTKYFGAQSLSRGGVEIVFSTPIQYDFIQVEMRIIEGSIRYRMLMRLHYSPATIGLFDNSFTEQTVTTFTNPVSNLPIYRNLKIVWDTSLGTFVRLILAGNQYDVSAFTIYSDGSTTTAEMELIITLFGLTTPQASMNIASVLVTADEP